MNNEKRFDLVKEKPSLDIPTLNYVWDWIWRMNAVDKPTNADGRSRLRERERFLKIIQDMADWETETAQTGGE